MRGNKTEGRISIAKLTSNTEPNYMLIQIEDESSGIEFVEVKLSLENFAQAITGLGHVPCKFKTRGLEKIGLIREHKVEEVYINFHTHPTQKASAKSAITNFETDGWKGWIEDAFNHHNFVREHAKDIDVYRINFDRWVENEKSKNYRIV